MKSAAAEFGLLATARYVPHLRLERSEVAAQHRWMAPGLRGLAKGRRAIANWDEDAVTMAVEAGRLVLRGLNDAQPEGLALASTSFPFADRLNSGIVASALGLPGQMVTRDVSSSMRAASTELIFSMTRPRRQ